MDPLHTKAYAIFVAEVEKHLATLGAVLAAETVLTAAELKDARIRLHTIKGGAGFFTLTEIARLAGELEEVCKQPPSEVEKSRLHLRQSIDMLKKMAAAMPAPRPNT